MFFKKTFDIELDDIPKNGEDMCLAVASYCAKNNLTYEFIKRTEPLVVMIDGVKYEVVKKLAHAYVLNCWVLRCKEM